jgi:hypothetical protein
VHALLVAELVRYITICINSPDLAGAASPIILLADIPGTESVSKPPSIKGFFPDVYVGSPYPIIGEAKTLRDLETEHSMHQLTGFLRFLSNTENGRLFLAVPLPALNFAKAIVRNLCREIGCDQPLTDFVYLGASSAIEIGGAKY